MNVCKEAKDRLGRDWLADIYVNEVRPLRTRAFAMDVPERENQTEVAQTLLGYELKVSSTRFLCPNADTARYLQFFARIGCRNVAIPYVITELGGFNKRLSSAWDRFEIIMREITRGLSPQHAGKARAAAIRAIREEIERAGAGELMPAFDRPTKQRS